MEFQATPRVVLRDTARFSLETNALKLQKKILKISMGPTGYHVGPIENKCIATNPNHCFTNTRYKSISFTDVDCPEPQGRVTVGRNVGLICLRQGTI